MVVWSRPWGVNASCLNIQHDDSLNTTSMVLYGNNLHGLNMQ